MLCIGLPAVSDVMHGQTMLAQSRAPGHVKTNLNGAICSDNLWDLHVVTTSFQSGSCY